MRALATCVVALGLALSPTLVRAAGTGNDSPAAANATNSSAKADPGNSNAATPNAAAANAEPSSAELENELHEVRELLESQTRQIAEQQRKMELLEEELKTAKGAESSSLDVADPTAAGIGPVNGAVATPTKADSQNGNPDEPASIHFKGITLTPGGFTAAETVWRQKALASDVNTPLNSIPFEGSSNAHISEFQASGRQSRISMLMQGQLTDVKIGGYYEADFLSAGTTSNPNQSNSYTLRQRQFWGQAAFTNGFTFTGGQQWSLITETQHGMDNRTENLPMTIDAQYHVGFSWARQYGARVTYNFGNKVWLGASIEESQPTITVHGNPTVSSGGTEVQTCTAVTDGACTTGAVAVVNQLVTNNYLAGAFGTGGGLYNPVANYGYNLAPDFIVKAVFEPGFGHYEVFGLLTEFHDRTFPCADLGGTVFPSGVTGVTNTTPPDGCSSVLSGAFATNDSRVGGGAGANARWALFAKKVDLGFHFFGGSGIGRYGSGGLPDLTVRPDGTLVPLHNFQSLGTLQFHPVPKLDIYLNVGGEFEERAAYTTLAGKAEGYGNPGFSNSGCLTEVEPLTGPSTSTNLGVPTGVGGGTGFIPGPLGSCTGDTRNLIEGTIGFWYRFYQGPKGRFQYGMQYSNVDRNTWKGSTGPATNLNQPHADENMVFTSFRYYLP